MAKYASAAVSYIKSRPDLKNLTIGLIGHSEGGIIAPMVAAENSDVNFVVLLAGPGIPMDQLLLHQSEDLHRLNKVPADITRLNLQTSASINSYLKGHISSPLDSVKAGLRNILLSNLRKYPKEEFKDIPMTTLAEQKAEESLAPWYRYFVAIDPSIYLRKVRCPLLALNGTLDSQVRSVENLQAIEGSLKAAKNMKYQISPMPGLNHLFQKASTGNVSEYAQIEETVNQAALQKVSDWIIKL